MERREIKPEATIVQKCDPFAEIKVSIFETLTKLLHWKKSIEISFLKNRREGQQQ